MITDKNSKIIIRVFAIIEILIGVTISLSFIITSLISPPGRPKSVYWFVIITSVISIVIGAGLFKYKRWARIMLIFFAGYVAISKPLLFTNLVKFTGNTIEFMPTNLKDIFSFLYHCIILGVFNLKDIKKALN